jgi:hypothetical protein
LAATVPPKPMTPSTMPPVISVCRRPPAPEPGEEADFPLNIKDLDRGWRRVLSLANSSAAYWMRL